MLQRTSQTERDLREAGAAFGGPATSARDDPTLRRLDDEIHWYSSKSARCQRLYKWLKFVEIVTAAAIPVLAAFSVPAWAGAVLGGVIVVLEGLQHVNQYQNNWTTYRSTAEALKHEKYLYLAKAGPYRAADRHELLAERIESLISQENAKWVSTRQEAAASAAAPKQD